MRSGNLAARAELVRRGSRCPTIGSPRKSAKVSVTLRSRVGGDIRRIIPLLLMIRFNANMPTEVSTNSYVPNRCNTR